MALHPIRGTKHHGLVSCFKDTGITTGTRTHPADQKHQSSSPVLLTARPQRAMSLLYILKLFLELLLLHLQIFSFFSFCSSFPLFSRLKTINTWIHQDTLAHSNSYFITKAQLHPEISSSLSTSIAQPTQSWKIPGWKIQPATLLSIVINCRDYNYP